MMKELRGYQQEIVDKILQTLKSSNDPILIDASVGSGKSLILSSVLLVLERAGFKALCLTLNSTLIQQNAETYNLQGGNAGIYCAGLQSKSCKEMVIFGSPHSVTQDIRNKGQISKQPFRLIVIDECHNINPHDSSSMYMRILNHYSMLAQQDGYSFKIIGLTGTPYRDKATSIVGPNMLFKSKLCSVSASWLIENNYLTRPYFGLQNIEYDFRSLRVNSFGKFNANELQHVVDENIRLTGEIMLELQKIECNGMFIFASTRKHCEECARSLPDGQWAIITGTTPHHEREFILRKARAGEIRYLINVNVLTVGVDVPNFDVCAFLRPTESLVLYTQAIGRVLRLSPGKERALILDYSGNLERHGDIDDPIINAALQPKEDNEQDYIIPCYTCGTNNTLHARRCIGMPNNARCEHYFEFKDCHACGEKNDTTSRYCRSCDAELIDPNEKLKKIQEENHQLTVKKAKYFVSFMNNGTRSIVINAFYTTTNANVTVFEKYALNTEKSKNICYAKFIRAHVTNSSDYYMHMHNPKKMDDMIRSSQMQTPHTLICSLSDKGEYKIIKKVF